MRVRIKCLTFYFAWILYIFNYILFQQSQFKNMLPISTISYLIKCAVVVLLLFTILYQKKIKRKIFILSVVIALIYIMSFVTASSWTVLFWGLFLLAAMNNTDYESFLKIDMIIRFSLYLFVFICTILGILENNSYIVYGNEKVSFGYIHYNMFGMNMGVLVTEIIALFRDKRRSKAKMYAVLFVICALQISVGVGRTGLYGSIVVIIISLLLENSVILQFVRKHNKLFSLCPIIFAFISYAISYAYDRGNKWMVALNYILSTRIAFSNRFLKEYNLSILGNKLYINNDASSGVYSALDMGYIRVGLEYGVLVLLLLLIIFYLLQVAALKANNIGLYLAVMYFSVALLFASSVLNIANNWILIFTLQILVWKSEFFIKSDLNKGHNGVNIDEGRALYSLQNR